MSRMSVLTVFTVCLVLLAAGSAFGGKPQDDNGNYLGNGYPSGFHFNLNLIAKPDTFSCPPPQFFLEVIGDNTMDGDLGQLVENCDEGDVCVETDMQIFGNVIFFPREPGDPITLLMESGRKGPRSAPDAVDLEVIDWCTESFPDDGSTPPPLGDGAMLRLPKNEAGYAVYGKVTGKPGGNQDDHAFRAIPELYHVEDETGNDLILLGLVSSDGVFQMSGEWLRRTHDATKGNRTQKATNITGMFEWTGDVCYIQDDWDLYCVDEQGVNTCTQLSLCCVDVEPDGVYERCDLFTDVGIDPLGDGNLVCPDMDLDGNAYVPLDAQCKAYDNEWVFNIGDFVEVLWNVDTTGAYVVKLRFYPLPLNQ